MLNEVDIGHMTVQALYALLESHGVTGAAATGVVRETAHVRHAARVATVTEQLPKVFNCGSPACYGIAALLCGLGVGGRLGVGGDKSLSHPYLKDVGPKDVAASAALEAFHTAGGQRMTITPYDHDLDGPDCSWPTEPTCLRLDIELQDGVVASEAIDTDGLYTASNEELDWVRTLCRAVLRAMLGYQADVCNPVPNWVTIAGNAARWAEVLNAIEGERDDLEYKRNNG